MSYDKDANSHLFTFVVHPFIIEDKFTDFITVLAPESFTISVEFIVVCMKFNVTWAFNGSQIIDDSNQMIVNSDLSNSRYKTSVKIIKSSETNSGVYTVTVTSVAGSDSVNITTKVLSELLCLCIYVFCILLQTFLRVLN